MHRHDRACHWCGVQSTPAWQSSKVLGTAAGIAALSLLSVGAWSYRTPIRDTAQLVIARVFAPGVNTTPTRGAVFVSAAGTAASAGLDASMQSTPTVGTDSGAMIASSDTAGTLQEGAMVASAADSITWTPAVARTWVNVRNDASRGGNVVGVINPASRAMLGTTRAGWRQVKSPDVTGWADPRLFEPDSNRTRGL